MRRSAEMVEWARGGARHTRDFDDLAADGIAEEVKRQLQLGLATAAIAARRAIAVRHPPRPGR